MHDRAVAVGIWAVGVFVLGYAFYLWHLGIVIR